MQIEDSFNPFILKNKNIIITGGSSGIGLSVAKVASEFGASLIIVGRDETKLKKAVTSFKNAINQDHRYFKCDLSSFNESNELFNQLRSKYSHINGIVWSAGSELIKSTRIISDEDVMRTFGASNFGFLGAAKSFSSKRFWKSKDEGSIVIISSIASRKSMPGMAVYGASKSSYSGMLSPLAKELACYNTRINSLLLGAVKTNMHKRISKQTSTESLTDYENRHLFGFGETSDVSPMVIFLLSNLSKWITGTEIVVDGGYSANF